MSAWVLPDHIADVLPSEARHIEELRRLCLDTARGYGYELVMPPLLEHLESLLSGPASTLDLRTFKLVDQLSGRTLGLRADTTSQVARIDAHLLNRQGVTRLCYCGPVLHTRPNRPYATREPLQFGAEIYGHDGLEADLEILQLALDSLKANGQTDIKVDLGSAQIIHALLADQDLSVQQHELLIESIAKKDSSTLQSLSPILTAPVAKALLQLVDLYGDSTVLNKAEKEFSAWPLIQKAIADLRWLTSHLQVSFGFDLSDMSGYAYYSGTRFSIYAPGVSDALVRGGRYDEVGAVFGRKRPAVGFSFDLKELVSIVPKLPHKAAIRAPWREDASLTGAIARLRAQGEAVVCVLPGHESEVDEFDCDRELLLVADRWIVKPL
jgi:ATP phosphoribosyltransferase regulatory subunit